MSSARLLQPRRRAISNKALAMRGAFWLMYIISAVSEKLSILVLETYACSSSMTHQSLSFVVKLQH